MQNLTDALRTIGLSDSQIRTAIEVTHNWTAAHYPVFAAISKKEVYEQLWYLKTRADHAAPAAFARPLKQIAQAGNAA